MKWLNWGLSVHTFAANSVCFKEEVIHAQASKEAEVFLLPQKIISLKEIHPTPKVKSSVEYPKGSDKSQTQISHQEPDLKQQRQPGEGEPLRGFGFQAAFYKSKSLISTVNGICD